jgi:hypothetical protein
MLGGNQKGDEDGYLNSPENKPLPPTDTGRPSRFHPCEDYNERH